MNSADFEKNYWMQLFANLLNACPIDTRNMQTHIVMFENSNEFVVEVNAPFATNPKVKKESIGAKSDYAYDVNYASRSPHKHWIEEQIEQTARIFNAKVTYLGGKK